MSDLMSTSMQAQMRVAAAFVTDIFNLLKQRLQESAENRDMASRDGILSDMIRHPEEYAEVSAGAGESSQRLKEILDQNNIDYEVMPGNPAYGKEGGMPDQFILHVNDLQKLIDEDTLFDDTGRFTKSYNYTQDAHGQNETSGRDKDNTSHENGHASDREKDESAFSKAESTDREQEEDAFGRTQEERRQDEAGGHETSFFGGQVPDFEEDLSKNLRTGRNGRPPILSRPPAGGGSRRVSSPPRALPEC